MFENRNFRHDYKLLRRLAYESWLARGMPEGSPDVDWTSAEKQLEQKVPADFSVSTYEQLDRTDDA